MTDTLEVDLQKGIEQLEWYRAVREAPPNSFDLEAAKREIAELAARTLTPGSRIGVAVGSRGISQVADIVAAVVAAVGEQGATAVLIPAMGSHGGASSEGQVAVLEELGVHAAALGVSIDASMEVEQIGALGDGRPVYLAGSALACDAVIPVNRVKPHSDFRARVESGLTKMLTIGLGKEQGASSLHGAGFPAFDEVLPAAYALVHQVLEVPFGVALLEDAWHRLRKVVTVPGEEILERDRTLLADAWEHFPRLPFESLDILVLREIGKTISGSGMDPNVTGRFANEPLAARTQVGRIVVLDLTEDSGGNAIGVGLADVVTERMRNKIDWRATYANAIASKSLGGAKLPVVAASDAEAIALAVASLTGRGDAPLRAVCMANTLAVHDLAITEALVDEAQAAGYVVSARPRPASFDERSVLRRIGKLAFFAEGPGASVAHRGAAS